MRAPHRPPRVFVPTSPSRSARRRRRRALAVVAAVLLVLGVAGAVGALLVFGRHPGAPTRLRALAAGGTRRVAALFPGSGGDGGGDGAAVRPARLACTPAVTGGAAGEVRTLAALDAAERTTALFVWPEGRGDAEAERRAVRALSAQRGVAVVPLGGDGALAVTADGATLRALAARVPGAAPQLAVPATRELCVLD